MAGFDVSSTVEIDMGALEKLTSSATKALALTGAALLSEVKNAKVFPFNDSPSKEKGNRKTVTPAGNLQNDNTFVEDSHAARGRVEIISSTPYARRLYYHPEYNYYRGYNANARGRWYEPWLPGGQHEDFAAETFAKIYKKENNL